VGIRTSVAISAGVFRGVVDGRGGRECGGEVGGGGVERGCCEGGQVGGWRIGGIVIDGGATCLAGVAATYGEPPAACLPQRSGVWLSPALLRCFIKHQGQSTAFPPFTSASFCASRDVPLCRYS
jgi:hypothetical protein